MLATLNDATPALLIVQMWLVIFRQGRENLEVNRGSRSPLTTATDESIDHVHDVGITDNRLIINQIVNAFSIHEGVENILHNEVRMTKIVTFTDV